MHIILYIEMYCITQVLYYAIIHLQIILFCLTWRLQGIWACNNNHFSGTLMQKGALPHCQSDYEKCTTRAASCAQHQHQLQQQQQQ